MVVNGTEVCWIAYCGSTGSRLPTWLLLRLIVSFQLVYAGKGWHGDFSEKLYLHWRKSRSLLNIIATFRPGRRTKEDDSLSQKEIRLIETS